MFKTLWKHSRVPLQISVRNYPHAKKPKIDKKFQAANESLAARGFLRPLKAYSPPSDVEGSIESICKEINVNPSNETTLNDTAVKFKLLRACANKFDHAVPNSRLHTVENIGDLIEFYKTPIDTRTPFDALKQMELPKNLHIQHEPHRFHPEKDTMFGGISAFPKSSTIVTGLKYKKKYEGYIAKRSWP